MNSLRAILVTGLAMSVSVAILFKASGDQHATDEDYLAALGTFVLEELEALSAISNMAREGAAWEHLANPEIQGRVQGVTIDENRNVYFILNDSSVTNNVGFIARDGQAEFLGDGQEPKVEYTEHLWGDWWYYKSM